MSKTLLRQVNKYQPMYIDNNTGIVWIEDGSTGMGISVHPNIDVTGSVKGMKELGYWDKTDKIVRSHGYNYNISKFVCNEDDTLEMIVSENCQCEECIKRRY